MMFAERIAKVVLYVGLCIMAGGAAAPANRGQGHGPQAVPITFRGVVLIDRPDVRAINALCKDQMVAWMCADGQAVAKGDPIIIFDTAVLQQRTVIKEYDLRIAEATLQSQDLRLTAELQALQEEQEALRGELKVVRAELNMARSIDPDQVALLRAEYERAVQRAADQKRQEMRKQELLKLGELAADDVAEARLDTAKAENEAHLGRLRWQHQAAHIDDVAVARLVLDERELLMKLGGELRAADPQNDSAGPKRGIARQLEALTRKIESERAKNTAALKRARKELHEAVRDAYDRTPLSFIEIFNAEADTPLRRICFGTPGSTPPDEYQLDDGAPFDEQRGYGWDRDMKTATRQRDQGEPLQTGVILIRQQATWSCQLPDGEYRLKVGVGDSVDWHGPLIRHNGRVLFGADKIASWETFEQTVTVSNGKLALVFADGLDKVLRATEEGVAGPQPWLRVGRKIGWMHWPIAYFSDPGKFRVQALVRQDMVSLLKVAPATEAPASEPASAGADDTVQTTQPASPAPAPTTQPTTPPAEDTAPVRIAAARQQVAAVEVQIVTPGGAELSGSVASIGTTPVRITRAAAVWYWGGEQQGKDLIARQVLIAPTAEQSKHLRLGETVYCTAWITPAPTMRVLGAHMVAQGEARNVVTLEPNRQERPVEGFRVGRRFFVTAGLEDEDQLSPPIDVDPDQREPRRTFPGQIVAGKRVAVGIPTHWGRIKDMVPDGEHVEKDQLIIHLYNPYIEANREKSAEQKVKARENYLVAMEARQVKTVEARQAHQDKVVAERRARLEVRALQEQDPIPIARAQVQRRQALLEADLKAERYRRLDSMTGIGKAELEAARVAADKLALRLRRAELAEVAAVRQENWLALNEARQAWLDAVEALSLRDIVVRILRKEEQVARMAAQQSLNLAMEGNRNERRFERVKNIKAPAAGRLFYLTSWNDHTQSRTKIMKDFVVWRGLPIAEILDMSQLGMEAELPESLYSQIETGTQVIVGFAQYPGVEVDGTIESIGKSFYVPKELTEESHGRQSVSLRRAFTIKVLFAPPARLAEHLIPGTKGHVYLP
jgi:hypothetical protein